MDTIQAGAELSAAALDDATEFLRTLPAVVLEVWSEVFQLSADAGEAGPGTQRLLVLIADELNRREVGP